MGSRTALRTRPLLVVAIIFTLLNPLGLSAAPSSGGRFEDAERHPFSLRDPMGSRNRGYPRLQPSPKRPVLPR
jgi:hypothetical protein